MRQKATTFVFSVGLLILGAVSSLLYGFGQELAAEAPSTAVTPYDCKRHKAADLSVRCVCLQQDGQPYFCSFPTPKDRWGGPAQDKGAL